jgi:hypothetical protein
MPMVPVFPGQPGLGDTARLVPNLGEFCLPRAAFVEEPGVRRSERGHANPSGRAMRGQAARTGAGELTLELAQILRKRRARHALTLHDGGVLKQPDKQGTPCS